MKKLILSALLAACGGEVTPPTPTVNLFPLASGNRWVYRVTEPGKAEETKIQTMTATTGGYRFSTVNGSKETISVQRLEEETRLVRLREKTVKDGIVVEYLGYSPPALRLDIAENRLGSSYTTEFTEQALDARGNVIANGIHKVETFRVEADGESITVEAGTFDCVRLRRDTDNGTSKTFWYADGVGKVKEEGGQVEELVRYELTEP